MALLLTSYVVATPSVEACTRALYVGDDGTVITGRSMDWSEEMQSNMWAIPRGIKRDGAAGPGSITWTSRYGSVGVSGYEAGIADGMNEAGLVANMLYLAESDYGNPVNGKPPMSISLWAQYALDNFATVTEAVDALRQEPFAILAPSMPNGSPAQLHLAISDPTGDSAIFEYIGGKLIIHHGKQYPRDDQLAALRRPIGLECLLGGYRLHIPSGDKPGARPLRARLVPDQRDSEIHCPSLHQGRAGGHFQQPGRGRCAQRDPQRQCALGHHHPEQAQHFRHDLAQRRRPDQKVTSSIPRPARTRSGSNFPTWI